MPMYTPCAHAHHIFIWRSKYEPQHAYTRANMSTVCVGSDVRQQQSAAMANYGRRKGLPFNGANWVRVFIL
jgi:hypothetical protein